MEGCSDQGALPSDLIKTWTFIIRGGQAFNLKVTDRLGPGLTHDGNLTVWKMVGTEEEAVSVEGVVTGPLIGARVVRHTEVEDEEMRAIRRQQLGLEE